MLKKYKSHENLVILQILPALNIGGIERGTIEFSNFMIKKGYKNFIVSSGGKLLRDRNFQNHSNHIFLNTYSKNPLTIISNIFKIKKIIVSHEINLVHARSRAPAWSAFFACKLARIPFVTTFHGTYNFKTHIKKFYNSIMLRGDRTIAISSYIQNHILKNYKFYIKKEKIVTINRGVDHSYFKKLFIDDLKRQEIYRRWNIKNDHPIIIFPGRLTFWKGQLHAIQALDLLAQSGIKFHAVFLGSDQGRHTYSNKMREKICAYNLQNQITIDQDCSDMSYAYNCANLVIHTSIEPEAFGRVIIEAQACQCLVIASKLGAPKTIIQDKVNGFLYHPGDAIDLSEKIKDALALDPAAREKIIDNAYQKVLDHYSNEKMFNKTLDVYHNILKNYE